MVRPATQSQTEWGIAFRSGRKGEISRKNSKKLKKRALQKKRQGQLGSCWGLFLQKNLGKDGKTEKANGLNRGTQSLGGKASKKAELDPATTGRVGAAAVPQAPRAS